MGEGRRGGCVYNAHLLRRFDDEHTETCSATEGRKVQFSSSAGLFLHSSSNSCLDFLAVTL